MDTPRTGRPRDERVDAAILAATRDVLTETGYARLTMDAVAARAGAGKAAIYRRYATKQELVYAATVHDLDLRIPPDTGSLTTDLKALIDDILATMGSPTALGSVPGLMADVSADPALAARFQQTFVARQQECITAVLDRAVHRGELQDKPDLDVLHALLAGPVFVWLYLLRRSERDSFAHDLATRLADAVTK
ncbi:TetR-like C-terminal domain-containing protein [Streptosporangium sp. KLBMP 9127]|nr:TetR/AcrR family transcriptional regulator C-terminal ligand-binding domain-containing protein [Streptosporangium sp. KLBMP 9127]